MRSVRPRDTAAVALLATLLLGTPSLRAQSAADRAEAQALFDQGAALMAKRDFAAACPKLEASLARFDGVGTRGKLAQCYEGAGRIASAWAMYREVAVLAGKSGDQRRATVASEAAKALEPRLPRLVIAVPDASRVTGLTVTRNGVAVSEGAWGSAVPVDPGEQRIEATAPGHETWRAKLDVAESAERTVEVPALERSPQAPVSTGGATAPADEGPEPIPEQKSATPWKTIGLVAAGAGVVSLGVGGFFGLRASSKWNGAFDDGHCSSSDNTCDATGQELTDEARDAAVLSNVFIGTGAVLTAGGLALFFLAPSDARAETGAVRVVPVAGRSAAGVFVDGAF
jgi:hypothetical protein